MRENTKQLVLERREQENTTVEAGPALIMPMPGEDYWSYRVVFHEGQALLGFPKYSTIGIGFAVEEDWNTNLPYRCDPEEILEHIFHNAGPGVTKKQTLEAIKLIASAVYEDRDYAEDPIPRSEP